MISRYEPFSVFFPGLFFTAQCGGMISGTSGTITSPGYPDDYPDDVVCEWIFQGPIVHYLTIKFTSFALQPSTNCTNDFLAVYDGRNSSGECDPLLRRRSDKVILWGTSRGKLRQVRGYS